jgi:hypothetical protein
MQYLPRSPLLIPSPPSGVLTRRIFAWARLSYFWQHILTLEELNEKGTHVMNSLLAFAQIANDVYDSEYHKVDLQGWTRATDNAAEFSAGSFLARAYHHPKLGAYTVAFRGTYLADFKDGLSDVDADIRGIGLGSISILKLAAAMSFSGHWARKSKHFWLVGHSLGGAYVQVVAARLNLFGMTFNAPGVLHLVNQLSGHPLEKLVGSVSTPVMQVLVRTIGRIDLVSFLDKAASSEDNSAFPPVANYRASGDIVSLCGIQVGAPEQSVKVAGSSDPFNQHSMERLVEAFGGPKVVTPPPPGPQTDSLNSLRRDA